MAIAPSINLTEAERVTLERWVRGQITPSRLVQRAQIILQAAQGRTNKAIAESLGIGSHNGGRWRRRFRAHRGAGIGEDEARPGRGQTRDRHLRCRPPRPRPASLSRSRSTRT